MAKYIIDLNPDCVDGEFLKIPIRVAGENLWIKTKASLTPYTEPDDDEIRQMAHEEAWDFATSCIDMDGKDFYECFKSDSVYYLTECTYSEAKAKYDDWKKKEEICVGDEVIIKSDGIKGVIIGKDLCGEFYVFTENGCCEEYRIIHFEKTDRHFDEAEELLRKMRAK